jgi:hypothetical protein
MSLAFLGALLKIAPMTTTFHPRNLSILISGSLLTACLPTLAADGKKSLGYSNTPIIPGTSWHVHDGDRPQPRVVTSPKFSEMAAAPSDAVVLFDGTDLSKWKHADGSAGKWKIENGYMEVVPKSGILRTRDEFGDFQLHIELATPVKVEGSGQGRGNNGVNIFGRYEIQVLDSFNNPTYPDGQAAAIYGQTPPLVNSSRGPGEWQTYDIIFEAPRWEGDNQVKKAYVTVLHNGVVVHHRREILGTTGHRIAPKYGKPQEKGPLELYEHGNPVRFRNIWIRPLGEYDKP